MTDQIGRVLGDRYRLTAPVGAGASAHVFLADDVRLHRQVAVKLLHSGIAQDAVFLRRFRAEARSIAKLNHPNIVGVHDWSEGEEDEPYLVLEYLAGGSLRALLDTGYRLSLAQVRKVGIEAAEALKVAHAEGYVHRDIKPANLLFGDDGRLRIADFGLASSLIEAAFTEPGGGPIGTVKYAVPEQATGVRLDTKADIYALGLVLIEAVTGTVPLLAETMAGIIMRRSNEAVPVPEAMGPLRPILERMGQPLPADRPTAHEVIEALTAVTGPGLGSDAPLPLVGAIDLRATTAPGDATMMPGSRLSTDADDAGLPIGQGRPSPKRVALFDQEKIDGGHPIDRAGQPPSGQSPPGQSTPGQSPGGQPTPEEPPAGPSPAGGGHGSRLSGRANRLRIGLALVLVAGLIGGGWFVWQALRPASATIPNVDSMVLADAQQRLSETQRAAGDGLAWKITVRRSFNETVQQGAVVSQQPPAGERLDDGGRITLIVSDGPPPVAVPPDIVGRTEPEVEAVLVAGGLRKGAVVTQADEAAPAGQLLTWRFGEVDRPAAVPKGSKVDLVLSAGPAPRQVPGLAGMTLEQATAELAKIGLGVAAVEEFHPTVKAGEVIRTNEATGSEIPRDAKVTVVVSKGPDLVTVPSIKGLTLEEAYDRLEAAGLVVGEVFGNGRGKPDSTDPDSGQKVVRGTKVDIILKR